MTTTKKVATKGVVKTNKKKVAKKATAKSSVKKTRKTTRKKVTKVTTKKSSKKKSDSLRVKVTASHRKTFSQKLEKLEAIHKGTTVTPAKKRATKEKLQLAVLSPYRFPIQIDIVAVQAARFGGVFFVFVGALFAFINLQVVTGSNYFAAFTDTSDQAASLCDQYQNCSSSSFSTISTTSTTSPYLDREPDVRISINQSAPLTEQATIVINVPGAEAIKVFAYNKELQTEHIIGNAERNGDERWVANWNTTNYIDGAYKIRALVKNEYGIYEKSEGYFIVENNPVNTETVQGQANGETSSSTLIIDDTATATTSEHKDVGIVLVDQHKVTGTSTTKLSWLSEDQTNPVSGTVRLKLEAEGVEEVKLTAVNTSNSERKILGYAFSLEDNSWRYVLDSNRLKDGEYKIIAQAFVNDEVRNTDSLHLSINNSESNQDEVLDGNQEADVATSTEEISTDEVLDFEKEALDLEKLQPKATLFIRAKSPVSDWVGVRVDVEDAQYVEMYATQKFSGQPNFLGLATKVDSNKWLYTFNTKNIPNGEYKISSKFKTKFGVFESDFVSMIIFNEVEKQQLDENKEVQELIKTNDEIETITIEPATTKESEGIEDELEKQPEEDQEENKVSSSTDTESENDNKEIRDEEDLQIMVTNLLADYKVELDKEFKLLAAALRANDEKSVNKIKERIKRIQNKIIESSISEDERKVLLNRIDKKLSLTITRVEENVKKTEKIVKERTGKSATVDSDSDGITDFDEVNIFQTDPFTADSDGDGFNDGAEILNGFNPTDDTPEVLVAHESPKDTGVVREDILVVENVMAVKQEESDTDGVKDEAVISGKALPNSFVTLYIFSTPVVVTVKTDSDGSWEYRFDKELEDGQHEVYAGVTDNAGKIIAKSEPFTFVKEAQAFTPVDAEAGVTANQTDSTSIVSEKVLMVVLSMSVVMIGVVLIMVGIHMDRPRQKIKVKKLEKIAV